MLLEHNLGPKSHKSVLQAPIFGPSGRSPIPKPKSSTPPGMPQIDATNHRSTFTIKSRLKAIYMALWDHICLRYQRVLTDKCLVNASQSIQLYVAKMSYALLICPQSSYFEDQMLLQNVSFGLFMLDVNLL